MYAVYPTEFAVYPDQVSLSDDDSSDDEEEVREVQDEHEDVEHEDDEQGEVEPEEVEPEEVEREEVQGGGGDLREKLNAIKKRKAEEENDVEGAESKVSFHVHWKSHFLCFMTLN